MLRLLSLTIYHTISDTEGKSIIKMAGREPVCSLWALFSRQMPFSNSWEVLITLSCRENAYVHLTSRSDRDAWWQRNGGRDREHRRRGGSRVGVEWKRAEAQWNYINLRKCIWSWAFDRSRDGRMWSREGMQEERKCNTMMWLATDVFAILCTSRTLALCHAKVQQWQGYSAVIFPTRCGDTCSGFRACRFS